MASEHHGQVKFNGLPVPGATVTATLNDKTVTAVTDPLGNYSFPDLADGTWALRIEMLGFSPLKQDVAVFANAPSPEWELKMMPLADINAAAAPAAPPASATPAATQQAATPQAAAPAGSQSRKRKGPQTTPTNTQTAFQKADLNAANGAAPAQPESTPSGESNGNQAPNELAQRANDGFLINGTANNGAASPFAQLAAFGNNRRGIRSLYNGNVGLIIDNSIWDARSYSFTGQNTPKPDQNLITGIASFGGPLKIPHLVRNGPNIFINYQWTRNRSATTQPGLMPTEAEREGMLSPSVRFVDPTNGQPFPGNVIPDDRISPQAKALLKLYPLPNFQNSSGFNYQIPIVNITHQDSLQTRANKAIGRKNQVAGNFALQSTRTDTPNLFGFLDTGSTLGLNMGVNWRHNFTPRFFGNFGVQFSRFSTRTKPFFAYQRNISGDAGINGNNQEPVNYGPPALQFHSGISPLSDANAASNHNQTFAVSYESLWNRGRHNFSFGGDYRRQQFNVLSQDNPRGGFTFTGEATGYDFAGFLLGIPDTSALAFGNADKYFRASAYDAFINDDWRVNPSLTVNAGLRWEYWSPIYEQYGRLVNLDIAGNFLAESPVLASNPVGSLTGQSYPDSLVHPDRHGFQPRIAFSWRPIPASSMVVRGGYGIYYNTSTYQAIATQMAQQSPLSKTQSVQNTPETPLTLANGFNVPAGSTPNTFAVDPHFQVGYTHTWQLSVQRDLPASLVAIATYSGIKGTRAMQEFLPNTYPTGALNPCPACPSGFIYLASNGNSIRHAAQLQLRRRLHNGFTATLQYTYAKSIDDSALSGRNQAGALQGGQVLAQDWLDLRSERALSNFDQRHAVSLQAQYTTGMGVGGGTLLNGWRGALFKEWNFVSQINAGSGLPLTPIYPGATTGTGFTGTLRPNYTGASLYDAPTGLNLNPAAYTAPADGYWGNAGRNSITGPYQFTLNASLGRTFRLSDRKNIDWRFDATNALNHVTFPNWNTVVGGAQFGLPTSANQMRKMQARIVLRF
jgi:hypothetical protein